MGHALQELGIDRLSVDQRIALVQDIWDSVAVEAGLLPPSVQEQAVLDRRIAEDDQHPDNVVAWNTIKSDAAKRWQK